MRDRSASSYCVRARSETPAGGTTRRDVTCPQRDPHSRWPSSSATNPFEAVR